MRAASTLAAFALAGCNFVFGLEQGTADDTSDETTDVDDVDDREDDLDETSDDVVPGLCTHEGFDEDGDTCGDRFDNCPHIPNPDQKDTDSDGVGDECDPSNHQDDDILAFFGHADDMDGQLVFSPGWEPDGDRMRFTGQSNAVTGFIEYTSLTAVEPLIAFAGGLDVESDNDQGSRMFAYVHRVVSTWLECSARPASGDLLFEVSNTTNEFPTPEQDQPHNPVEPFQIALTSGRNAKCRASAGTEAYDFSTAASSSAIVRQGVGVRGYDGYVDWIVVIGPGPT